MTTTIPPTLPRAALTWHGVRTMAEQEFRLRLRAGRWRLLLALWFAVLLGFTFLLWLALDADYRDDGSSWYGTGDAPDRDLGVPMFGGITLFVLGFLLLIVPALTAQSVNGDREKGVLATLQATLLSPAEIAVGKLLAAWATAAVFVALMLPSLAWAVAEGGVGLGRVAVCVAVILLLLGVVCALAQCLSAVFARGTTSAVMSYLAVFALTALTPVAFGLAAALTYTERTETVMVPELTPGGWEGDPVFREEQVTYSEADTTKVWWLLAPNPFVILADAAPTPAPDCDRYRSEDLDPLAGLQSAVRSARNPGYDQVACGPGGVPTQRGASSPVWPAGAAFHLLLGGAALAVTVRKLRAPVRRLPKAVRVA